MYQCMSELLDAQKLHIEVFRASHIFQSIFQDTRNVTQQSSHRALGYTKWGGGSICNENLFITPSTNALGFYVICQTKDQGVAVKMVHETLFYLTNFNKLQTF